MDGLEATSRILAEADWDVRVLILTTFDPDEYVYKALRAGASGFVLKDIPADQLAIAVRTVADGGALLAPSITRRLIGRFAARAPSTPRRRPPASASPTGSARWWPPSPGGPATPRSPSELFIGPATVKSHVSSILDQARPARPHPVVVFAYESGLVEAGSGPG